MAQGGLHPSKPPYIYVTRVLLLYSVRCNIETPQATYLQPTSSDAITILLGIV